MEEDIEMLEKLVNDYKKTKPYFTEYTEIIISNIKYTDIVQAIEHLIARNKELEEIKKSKINKYLHNNLWICIDLAENYIHKSKVTEKTLYYEKLLGEEKWGEITTLGIKNRIVALQELLKD